MPEKTSLLLASILDVSNVESCLELSAGEGALVIPLKKKNGNIKFTMVDIDPINSKSLSEKYPSDYHICADALNEGIFLENESFDLAICNPPFSYVVKHQDYDYILSGDFGELFSKTTKIRLEFLFILRDLQLLKPNGTLAIIVPDLIFKYESLSEFRRLLFKKFTLTNVVECEYKSFKNAEAKTYILFIKKSKCDDESQYIPMISISGGQRSEKIIDMNSITRSVMASSFTSDYLIFRGTTSSKLCRGTNREFHHDYSSLSDFSLVSYVEYSSDIPSFKYAKKGDVLISRVGRSVGRTVILESSSVIVSDCVIVVRFSDLRLRDKFFSSWEKDKSSWLKVNSKGTCAKNISISSVKLYLSSLGID